MMIFLPMKISVTINKKKQPITFEKVAVCDTSLPYSHIADIQSGSSNPKNVDSLFGFGFNFILQETPMAVKASRETGPPEMPPIQGEVSSRGIIYRMLHGN